MGEYLADRADRAHRPGLGPGELLGGPERPVAESRSRPGRRRPERHRLRRAEEADLRNRQTLAEVVRDPGRREVEIALGSTRVHNRGLNKQSLPKGPPQFVCRLATLL